MRCSRSSRRGRRILARSLGSESLTRMKVARAPRTFQELILALERYWTEARLFAAFFGIPQDALPQSWVDFAAGNEKMGRSDVLTVSDQARSIAGAVLSGAGTRLPIPSWYRALTARLLPARLRDDFGLSYGNLEHRATERMLADTRRPPPSAIPLNPNLLPAGTRNASTTVSNVARQRLPVRLSPASQEFGIHLGSARHARSVHRRQ